MEVLIACTLLVCVTWFTVTVIVVNTWLTIAKMQVEAQKKSPERLPRYDSYDEPA